MITYLSLVNVRNRVSITVKPGELSKIKELVSRIIVEAYDVKVEKLRVIELEEREGIITLKGEWESAIEKGKYEARIHDNNIIFLRIEIMP